MKVKNKTRRFNTYFRQTSSSFKAVRQTQIYSHLRRKIPIKKISKRSFESNVKNANKLISNSFLKKPRSKYK